VFITGFVSADVVSWAREQDKFNALTASSKGKMVFILVSMSDDESHQNE